VTHEPSTVIRGAAALHPTPALRLANLSERSVSIEQQQLLSCYLQVPVAISHNEEFIRLMASGAGFSHPWIVQHTQTNVLQSVLSAERIRTYSLKVNDLPEAVLTPELALDCLKQEVWRYESLPPWLTTPEFDQRCLETGVLSASLMGKFAMRSQQIDYAALVEMDANNIKHVPVEHQSFKLCERAIKKNPYLIRCISPSVSFYQQLCILAVGEDADVCRVIPRDQITETILTANAHHYSIKLEDTPEHLVTYQRCCQAIQGSSSSWEAGYIPARIFRQYPGLAEDILEDLPPEESPDILKNLPDKLKTEDFCHRYLSKWPQYIKGCPLRFLRRHPEWIEWSLEHGGGYNLYALPESWRSFDLCQRALKSRDPCIEAIPVSMFEDHPDLLLLAAERCKGLSKIPPRLRTADVCYAALAAAGDPNEVNETMARVPDAVRKVLPYDLLLAVAPGYLPPKIREAMAANGDTALPIPYRQMKPILDQRHLMEPLAQVPYGELKYSSSVFLKKVLLSTGPFNLRNLALGHALQQTIQQHCQQRTMALQQGKLPLLTRPVAKKSVIYGGRTLMLRARDGFTRMKFLRKGELLDDFFREEAVHRFAHGHALTAILKSEVPQPVGVKLVPVDQLPEHIFSGFHSELERFLFADQSYYLVYEFTTCNQDYSTLAHQKESNGDSTRAEQGLFKACHDLGVWNSLGAVHTSTINAYHNFKDNRRELFLCFMFNNGHSMPGALTGWDTRATDESDWAYSGLKDIGDMEFYPRITSYFDAKDAEILLPVGFDQRVAFMSALVENMIAAVLHYARMHRDDPDYHYKNVEGRAKLGLFIDQAIGICLSGLMGKQVKTEAYFESPEIYQQWLNKTTAETTLWTARQDLDTDCFARNLEQTGCYSAEVYPGQKKTEYRYPKHFTSHGQDNLGCNHGQFGLTLLVRGLYQVAAVLAAKLGTEES